jgi:DNA helicase-2/ATP-dependent DNA helicase PcrA
MMLPTPRPKQQKILEYPGGRMGVAAVPGSGKTWTLSMLAANLLLRGGLQEDQEVLVVTLVNSAVDNFYQRVEQFLKVPDERGRGGLIARWGYRVRTLHGLAHDIVRQRPELLGLSESFQIIDEREGEDILKEAVKTWLHAHPYDLDEYLNSQLDEGKKDWVRREQFPDLLNKLALAFIRTAKDRQLTPDRLQAHLAQVPLPLPLVDMGQAIYVDYQRALNYRGAVDFDDLIRLALQALQSDEQLLEKLRRQWPYILEDEAQDSSRLQEEILRLLTGKSGNWVRVGDPNQAIYETFTTANPQHLRDFIAGRGVLRRDLPNSSRSTASIIALANQLVRWTQSEHPLPEARDALQGPPFIEPVKGAGQGTNPPDDPTQIHLVIRKFTPQEEVMAVADSLARWLPDHPESTVAVLAPRNLRVFDLSDELTRRGLPVVDDLLRSTGTTRASTGALANLLRYLGDPGSASKLATAYKVWQRALADAPGIARRERCVGLIKKCPRLEDYLYPGAEHDWLEELGVSQSEPEVYADLQTFRQLICRWQAGILLPVDQMLLTLSQDLFDEPGQLALGHKLAVLLRHASENNPDWRLPELTGELALIARNERRFIGFSEDDTGFDPDRYPGKIVLATMHKAKGLEWDRVYMMSVNNYDFPSGMAYDQYMPERWYIRGGLNLEAEALAQLNAALSTDEYHWYTEGLATEQARLDYVRERLRLLYVGITRARKELVITWNTGRRGDLQPAQPFVALQSWWEQQNP